jgi:hypothetical protein
VLSVVEFHLLQHPTQDHGFVKSFHQVVLFLEHLLALFSWSVNGIFGIAHLWRSAASYDLPSYIQHDYGL